jgi:hypothetical protein
VLADVAGVGGADDDVTAAVDALDFAGLVLPVHDATTDATPANPARRSTSRREGVRLMG